jgi:hypothetical protein
MAAWIDWARSLGRRDFLARHRGFFLLLSEDPIELSTFHETEVHALSAQRRSAKRRLFEIRFIEKAEGNPDPDRISVGRAGTCDLCIRHPSVSKVHAHFRVKGSTLTLVDGSSKNGTRANGKSLGSNQPRLLASHDRVEFGSVQAMVLDSRDFFELLSRAV